MYSPTLSNYVFTAAMLLVVAATLVKGRAAERWTIGVLFVAAVLSALVQTGIAGVNHIEWGILAVDAALLAYLAGLAVFLRLWWAVFAAGFQLLTVLSHLAVAVDPGVQSLAYFAVLGKSSYLVLIALLVGVWQRRQRPKAPADDFEIWRAKL